jgi:hypothetical protein
MLFSNLRLSRKKIIFIALCIFFISLLNLTKFYAVAERQLETNSSINNRNTLLNGGAIYENDSLAYFLLNPNSPDYKHYFEKYIIKVYELNKIALYEKNNKNQNIVYYKSKLDKLIE